MIEKQIENDKGKELAMKAIAMFEYNPMETEVLMKIKQKEIFAANSLVFSRQAKALLNFGSINQINKQPILLIFLL